MSEAEERRRGMNELVEAIKELTERVTTMDSNQQAILRRIESLEKRTDGLEEIVVDGLQGGLVTEMLRMKDWKTNQSRITWIMISVFLGGIGAWIGELVRSHFMK